MMTSLDMQGFSVSVLPVDASDEAALIAPVAPWPWPGCLAVNDVKVLPLPDGLSPIQPVPSDDPKMAAFLSGCFSALMAAEADLNALDAKSGDGDTGSTLATAARALEGAIDRLPLADATQLYRAIGLELSPDHGRVIGRASGDLLCRCGGRFGQRSKHRGRAESRAGPHPTGGRRQSPATGR